MKKIESMAKASNIKKIVQEDPYKAHTEGFIEGFNACIKIVNEAIEEEKTKLKDYPIMGERLFALKMYQERVNKLLKELEEETF
jgi:CO dehydrogenase/acetyl-CoA synthase gamma subunit (corrinoid Fe-S protein)